MQVDKSLKRQSGLISFYTVVLFAIILSTVAVGFAKIMVDEAQQTLSDDLSKSAYNSAQAGIEDAKRAMMYCASSGGAGDCYERLYNSTCPGFNATATFVPIGIPQSQPGSGTLVGSTSQQQGYSCVIITRDTPNITGTLRYGTDVDSAMYQLNTLEHLASVKLSWQMDPSAGITQSAVIPGVPGYPRKEGNARLADWNYDDKPVPTALRLTVIETPSGGNAIPNNPTLGAGMTMKSLTVIPDNSGVTSIDVSDPPKRNYVDCDVTTGICSTILKFNTDSGQQGPRYLMLQTLYNPGATKYTITPYTDVAGLIPTKFANVQPLIDATGYAGTAFRRVQAAVQYGLPARGLSAAVDAGGGICKDFRVSILSTTYSHAYDGETNSNSCGSDTKVGGASYLTGN